MLVLRYSSCLESVARSCMVTSQPASQPVVKLVDVETQLARYLSSDIHAVVRETCVVALDIADYNNSTEFQYANSLAATNTC